MSARLTSLTLTRFKSFEGPTSIPLKPLTVLIGRNNSGKSSLIQALLLLKQTLESPRHEAPLVLEGPVDALSLRELCFGWPKGRTELGIGLGFEASVRESLLAAQTRRKNYDLTLDFLQEKGSIRLSTLQFKLGTRSLIEVHGNQALLYGDSVNRAEIRLEHFLPINVFAPKKGIEFLTELKRLFDEPIGEPVGALRKVLTGFQYLSAQRSAPQNIYRPLHNDPRELGISGELAAQLLERRRGDPVHYLPPLTLKDGQIHCPKRVEERPLHEAINQIFAALGVEGQLTLKEIKEVGFRLLFGKASLAHVGRGLSHLLPLVMLGLTADPLRYQRKGPMSLEAYREACPTVAHLAFEELEAHLHPKVQSRLAHWLVSLAMSQRQLLVETHSDHLVRRLRGLMARATPGSDLERWLAENVLILEVEQDAQGRSTIKPTTLTPEGGLSESWPADFMDEAADEDREIFYAGLAKRPDEAEGGAIIHDEGEEPEVEP